MGDKNEQKDPKTAKPPPKSSSSFGVFSSLGVIVVAVVVYFVFGIQRKPEIAPELRGDSIPLRIRNDLLNELEKNRWNINVTFSFPGAKPVPVIPYNMMDGDFVDKLMEQEKPVLLRGSPIKNWPAFEKWKKTEYLTKELPTVTVHAPDRPVVRLHQSGENNLFMKLPVNWTRPWREEEVATEIFLEGQKLMYYMSRATTLPRGMQEDFWVSPFSVPWAPPMEVNLWMGVPTITTPAHYDMVHNFYTQVVGYKRWIMFPPEDHYNLYTFTALHPSARQSQVNFNDPSALEKFPEFSKVHPMEVILGPGDVLYIPPFMFHYVTVVGDSISMSLSTHSESQEAKIYERIFEKSYAFFTSYWTKYRSNITWTEKAKINAMKEYIIQLFETPEVAKDTIKKMLASHWDNLDKDTEVVGLIKLIQKGEDEFPSDEDLKQAAIPEKHSKRMAAAAREMKELLDQFSKQTGVKEILMGTHIEEISGRILGPLVVKPFLQHIVRHIEAKASAL